MDACKTELTKFKPKWFKFTESVDAGVDVRLFSEAVVPAFGVELHRDPIISCVMRQLFIASATYIFHTNFAPVAPIKGQADGLPRATKGENVESAKKGDAAFHLRVLTAVQTTQYSQPQL